MATKCITMHIDRTDEITVSREPARTAGPISALGLVCMPTYRTSARGSSFGAGEAHDVRQLRFMGEIVDIFAVFPQGHALIVMPTVIVIAHTVGIANEQRSHFLLHTEVDHLSRCFVPQITNTPFCPLALLVFRALQFLPATGILLATGLLLGNLAQVLMVLPLEAANTTSGDDQGLARVGRDCRQVDFPQVYSSLHGSRGVTYLWHFDAHVQFKAVVPHERTGTARFRQIKVQDKRRAPLAHWQDHPSFFATYGLSRPVHRIELLGPPGILHFHLRMGFAQLTGGFYIGKKSMHDHLDRLTMQSVLALGGLLQLIASRPPGWRLASYLVRFHTRVPDSCGFYLGGFQSVKLALREK